MMACSAARLAANRANALKSTGPKTAEGKEASRRNALKHGLTGDGVVVPVEDADEVSSLAGPLVLELAGRDGSPTARHLAERVATLIVRMKRSARHEFAATRERCRLAALEFDEVREAEAARLWEAIDEGSNREVLLLMPEGVDLLDAELAGLGTVAAAGDPGRWSRDDSARLARCLHGDARAHAEALGRALVDGDVSGLDRGVVAVMDPANVRGPWALDQVVGLVDAERRRLASTRPGLDHAGIARLRADAVSLALVDDAPATLLARKYEVATERALHRALREIREIRKSESAPAFEPKYAFPTADELARQADAMRRQFAKVEPAAGAPAPPLASSFLGGVGPAAGRHGSKLDDVAAAPRGRSRYEDRSKRPKLGR